MSAKNPQLQALRRAAASGRPTDTGLLIAEGPHLVEEALLRGHWQVVQIYVSRDGLERYASLLRQTNAEVTEVSASAFAATAPTETTQGILALLRPRIYAWQDLKGNQEAAIVVLDAVQDPGNAGTIVRSAEAFGATGVVFLTGSARVSNPKFLRATAGSIFRLPFLEHMNAADLIRFAGDSRMTLYTLSQTASKSVAGAKFRTNFALVVGNEGSGVSSRLETQSEGISIPIGKVESLNAAIACSIALYEVARQRSLR